MKSVENVQTSRPMSLSNPIKTAPLHRQRASIPNLKQEKLLLKLNLCRQNDRHRSFTSDWPAEFAPPGRDMAAAGWFYLGNLDRTQCFSCGGVLRNWRRIDNPYTEHITHFPHCAMAQGREAQNVPDDSAQELRISTLESHKLTDQQKSNLVIMFPCMFPVNAYMVSFEDRIKTFSKWHFTQAKPCVLAEAGFFSLGVRDRVKCFYCNGGLQNWKQNDRPWEEHAKWYPTCEYLLQQRGPEFVHSVVAKFPNIERPVVRAPGHDIPPPSLVQNKVGIIPEAPRNKPMQGELVETTKPKRNILDEAMKSDIAAVVIGLGFEESLVREVTSRNIQLHGTPFSTATSLLEAVEELQKIQEKEQEQKAAREEFSNSLDCSSEDLVSTKEEESLVNLYKSNEDLTAKSEGKSKKERSDLNSKIFEKRETEIQLKKTLQKLEDERLCKVCLDKPAVVVFIPCAHICCCMDCTQALRMCPICRMKIEKAVRTYTS